MNKATEAREWETDAYSNNRQVREMRVCERQMDSVVTDGTGKGSQV